MHIPNNLVKIKPAKISTNHQGRTKWVRLANKIDYRERFAAIAALADDEIHLDEAALLIAAETDTSFDLESCIQHLDNLALKFEKTFDTKTSLGISATALTNFIHTTEGFSGNVLDYYDPANSYLNRVIDTRVGIPISLALIHISLGKRLGIPVRGIKFPGHFLIKYGSDPSLIIDPFTGRMLSEPDCATLLRQIARNSKAILLPQYFDIASNKEILIRILDNLKQIFWEKKSWDEGKACIERQILLKPDHAEFRVQLGALYEMQGNLSLAKITYTTLLHQGLDKKLLELVSKRLLAMSGSSPTIH